MKDIELNELELEKIKKIELDALKEIDYICKKNNINYSLTAGTLLGAIRHKGFIPWDDDIDIVLMREDYNRLREICKSQLDSKYFFQCNESDPDWFRLYSKIRVNNTIFKELAHSQYNIHHGIYIDIFPLDKTPENKFLRNMHYFLFRLFSIGVSVKYINPQYRTKINKVIYYFLKILYYPFSVSLLYKMSDKIAQKYNNSNSRLVINFNGAYGKKEIVPQKYYSETDYYPFEDTSFRCSKFYKRILRRLYGDYMKLPPVDKRKSLHKIVELHF